MSPEYDDDLSKKIATARIVGANASAIGPTVLEELSPNNPQYMVVKDALSIINYLLPRLGRLLSGDLTEEELEVIQGILDTHPDTRGN